MMAVSDLSHNLARIRKARGIKSQGEMAGIIGVSRQAYSSFERGQSIPTSLNLMKIAQNLDVKMEDLLADPPSFKSLRYRTRKSLRSDEKNRLEELKFRVARWIADYMELEEITGEKRPFNLKFKSNSPIEAAEEARLLCNIDEDEPIDDIMGLLERHGMKFYPVKFGIKKFFGFSLGEADGGPAIIVNTSQENTVERRIFTVAHEFGHICLHGDSFGRDESEDDNRSKAEEKEADLFAGHFLLPDTGFDKEWKAARGHDLIDKVFHIKRKYRVSYETVLFRIADKGWADYTELIVKFRYAVKNRYGFDFKDGKEPLKLEEPDFLEDRFPALVRLAYEREEITQSKAAEMLELTLEKMKFLIDDWYAVSEIKDGAAPRMKRP